MHVHRDDGGDVVFDVSLEAHNILIPAVVKDNISPVIAVDVHATLNPR